MSTVLRVALGTSLVCGGVLLPGAPALAGEPDRAGWWNRASVAGAALPAPTTADGDLRITNAPDGPAAYAAVLYPSLGATGGTLVLAVRPQRTAGTPEVLACPTADAAWDEGGNQPYDKAPSYDCALGSAAGELAEDGTTLTFRLDTGTRDADGLWTLALVPAPGSTDPFTLDLEKPEADALTTSGSAEEPFVPEPSPPGPSDPDTSSTGTGEAFLPGGFTAPPAFDPGTPQAPLVAVGAEAAPTAPAAPTPAVAAATPLILARPVGVTDDLGSGRRLLALLVLAGGSAAVGYAAGQQRPGPRLIGGRSRLVTAGPAPVVAPGPGERPRGIGRFAKVRDEAPRRLR